jgi:CBS domain-containing protein
MTTKNPPPPDDQEATRLKPKHGGQFVERMFSGFGHVFELPHGQGQPRPEVPYHPLHQSRPEPGATYFLQNPTFELRVQANSPATDVMTDLSRGAAITIPPGATIDEAHEAMITHRVRALFAVDETRAVLGIITSTDILGEKPIQIAQRRGVRHGEVLVREVMTPADLLEAMELQDVMRARVGDVVETLKRSCRQHALVIESASAGAAPAIRTVRGIFSLTQIARQLSIPPEISHDIARTFAEIEAAIGP